MRARVTSPSTTSGPTFRLSPCPRQPSRRQRRPEPGHDAARAACPRPARVRAGLARRPKPRVLTGAFADSVPGSLPDVANQSLLLGEGVWGRGQQWVLRGTRGTRAGLPSEIHRPPAARRVSGWGPPFLGTKPRPRRGGRPPEPPAQREWWGGGQNKEPEPGDYGAGRKWV